MIAVNWNIIFIFRIIMGIPRVSGRLGRGIISFGVYPEWRCPRGPCYSLLFLLLCLPWSLDIINTYFQPPWAKPYGTTIAQKTLATDMQFLKL